MKRTPELPRRRQPRAVRLLRVTVKALAALALVYLVGINLFLSTPLFAKAFEGLPVAIRYRRGWSVIPGRIHVEDLWIRGRDSHVEWLLQIDAADFDMSFVALAKKRFDVSRVHGKGISFRLRTRLDAAPTSPEQITDLPPIEGFGPYTLRAALPPSADFWSDADYHLWTAHLERIVADDVRETWIDHERFEGSARIVGRFFLKPLRAVDVGPTEIEVRSGRVLRGPSTLADGLGGSRAIVTVAQFDPRTADATALVHDLSAVVDAHGVCPEIGELALAPPGGMKLSGPLEVRRLAIEVRNGVVAGKGRIEASAPHAVMTAGEHRFAGALALSADVSRSGAEARDELDFRIVVNALTVARADGVFLRAERAVVRGDSHELDLVRPLADLHVVVELPEGVLAHAHDLSAYIPKKSKLALLGGSARAEGRLEAWLADKRATGRGTLRADDLDFRLAKVRVRGTTSAQASFGAWRWETHRLEEARFSLDVSQGSIAADDAPDATLVRVHGLRIAARGKNSDLDDPLRDLHATITIPEGRIADRALLRGYLPKAAAMQVAFGRFSARCDVDVRDHLAEGTIDVRSKRLLLAYHDLDLAADVRARGRVHAWRWESGGLALDDATVDVGRVSVVAHGRAASAAAPLTVGRISMRARSARFAFDDPLARVTLDASIQGGKVSDASVINAFVPEGSTVAIASDDGAFSGEIHADVAKHVARGTIALRAENMGIAGRVIRLEGDAEVTAEVSDWRFDDDTMTVIASRAVVTRAKGSLQPRGAWDFGADRVDLSGRAPRLDLARPTLLDIDGRLVVENAVLPDARSLQTLLPADGIVTIESGSAVISADVRLSASESTATGILDVALSHAGIRFHEVHLVGDVRALARMQGYDSARGVVDLSGSTLEMRNLDATNASKESSHWRGNAAMRSATLRLSPFELDAALTLDADDANPILALALRNDLPGIFHGITDMPHVLASARLTMSARQFAFRDVDARGGGATLRGSYVVRDEHRRAAFVFDTGYLSVGLRLVDASGLSIRFWGLDGWLREQTGQGLRLWNGE